MIPLAKLFLISFFHVLLLLPVTGCAQNEVFVDTADSGTSPIELDNKRSVNVGESGPSSTESDETQSYRLIPGDVIQIVVLGEPSLSISARLDEFGTFAYPYLGRLNVQGMTLREVRELISSGLKGDYLLNPKVEVTMESFRDFYVRGEVSRPGNFSYRPGLTLRQAIALAGGFTERAARTRVTVVSENQSKGDGQAVDLDYSVKPGDVITVPRRFF